MFARRSCCVIPDHVVKPEVIPHSAAARPFKGLQVTSLKLARRHRHPSVFSVTRMHPFRQFTTMASEAHNIVFFHPDLGIGGAERLVIDAAVGLKDRGHRVTIFTSHCDPAHCFDEARDRKLPFLSRSVPRSCFR